MAARGTVAKQEVTEKLREAFGDNFIGEHEKKIYVWANDGGDRVQIAITLTCPKIQIETGEVSADSDSAFPTVNRIYRPGEEESGRPHGAVESVN